MGYLNVIKEVSCALQVWLAALNKCQNLLDTLNEFVQGGNGKQGNPFECCKLKRDKFLVGNKYDSGELLLCIISFHSFFID